VSLIADNPSGVAPALAASVAHSSDSVVSNIVLTLDSVSQRHGFGKNGVVALDGVTLTVERGEFVCLVGASGCGKTTLLSLVAGLDQPTAGTVNTEGRTALMFQESALLSWRTAVQNVELALKLGGTPRRQRRSQALEFLRMVHLSEFADKRPHELSGGMRQRVALARALAQRADILLMDEPFGALDAITRDVLHDELERVVQERGLTVLFVTHNVREASRLGDRIVLLSSRPGRVVEEFEVPVERPRRIESPGVSAIAAAVTTRLREEVRRHAR